MKLSFPQAICYCYSVHFLPHNSESITQSFLVITGEQPLLRHSISSVTGVQVETGQAFLGMDG